jgi:hypothetical protein
VPKDGKRTLIMVNQSHDTFYEYGFAGSGLAKDNEAFSFTNTQVNVSQHLVAPKGLPEMFHFNDHTTVMLAIVCGYCCLWCHCSSVLDSVL